MQPKARMQAVEEDVKAGDMKRALALAMIGMAVPAAGAPGPFTYQCTAPFWDESGLWQMNAGPLRRASGQIEVQRLEEIPAEWPPDRELRTIGPVTDMRQAEVMLSSVSEDRHVAVSVAPFERSSETINIWVSWQIDGEMDGRRLATVPRRAGRLTRIPFFMRNDGQRVIVEVAGERAEAPVALGADVEFRASCRGGEFMFFELDWGD